VPCPTLAKTPESIPFSPGAEELDLLFSLPWLAPAAFFSILFLWGWTAAMLHTAILIACTVVLVEILLIRFRKIPFTCSYPPFQSHSALIFVAYLFGFIFFTEYLPEMEHWSLLNPWQTILFAPPASPRSRRRPPIPQANARYG
jgi:hypothetical protein